MRAARWDTTWEQGGLWRVVLRLRLGADGELGAWAAPTTMEITDSAGAVVVTIDGELDNSDHDLIFARTAAQTVAVDAGRYRHRVLAQDPQLADVRVLLRGFVIVGPPEASP